jgi:uncharacterized protein YegL
MPLTSTFNQQERSVTTMKRITTLVIFAFALVGISSLALAQTEQIYHDNVMIVIDDSGSMSDDMRDANGKRVQKMEAARRALREVVKTIPDSTYIGLVSFKQGWLFELGPKNALALNTAIDKLSPGGGTPLGEYIKFGADVLLEQREKQHGYGSYRLLVLTDGEANDSGDVDRYTPEIMARGITFDVIGVDMDQDHTLANKVHSYRNAKDPDSLNQAVIEVLAEVPDKGDGYANNEAFELIAGLPDGFAELAVEALANSGNHPIGEKPRPKEVLQVGAQTSTEPQLPNSNCAVGLLLFLVVAILFVVGICVVIGHDYESY